MRRESFSCWRWKGKDALLCAQLIMADYALAIAETSESENEIIPSSQQTESDQERYAVIDKRNRQVRAMRERAYVGHVLTLSSEEEEEDIDSQLPTPSTSNSLWRARDHGETNYSRLSRKRFHQEGLKLESVMGACEDDESDGSGENAAEEGQKEDIAVFDLTQDSSSTESEDEFAKASGGLPFYPELRKGPASQGPRALTPPPPSPECKRLVQK